MTGYHIICRTCWRTNIQGTKANPTIHKPANNANWGLPTAGCLIIRLCVMLAKVTNPKVNQGDDAENLLW